MESKELLKEKVREILSGIDCCYQVDGGWWRAPGKASFGRDKLQEVIKAIDSIVVDNAIEEGWDYLPSLSRSTIDTERSTTMSDSSLNATEIAVGSLLAGGRGGYGGYGGGGGAWGGAGCAPTIVVPDRKCEIHGDNFGDPSANGVRADRNSERTNDKNEHVISLVDRNGDKIKDQNDHNRDLIDRNSKELDIQSDRMRESSDYNFGAVSDQFNSATRNREFHDVRTQMFANAKDASDQSFRSELRTTDQIRDNKDFMYQIDQRNGDQRFQAELRTNDRLLALQAEMNENARRAAECCCDLKLQACEDKAQVLASIAAVEGRGIERALNASQARVTQLETINAITQACGCCPQTGMTAR